MQLDELFRTTGKTLECGQGLAQRAGTNAAAGGMGQDGPNLGSYGVSYTPRNMSSILAPPPVDPIIVTSPSNVPQKDDQGLTTEERVQEVNYRSRDADSDMRYNLEMNEGGALHRVPATLVMDSPVSLNQGGVVSPDHFEWLDKDLDNAQMGNPVDWDRKETRCAGCMNWIYNQPKGLRYFGYSAIGTIILMIPGIVDLIWFIESMSDVGD